MTLIAYPTDTATTLRAADVHRELRATGHFDSIKLKEVEAPVTWAVLNLLWNSRRHEALRDNYDVAGFIRWLVADMGKRRFCIPDTGKWVVSDRLARHVRRIGVAPSPKAMRAATKRTIADRVVSSAIESLVGSAEHWTLNTGERRIMLDASIVLGDLLSGNAHFVMFAFEGCTVTLNRMKLVNVARALAPMPDVRCYLHIDANVPQLRFSWRGGAGGLHLNHPFSYGEWNMETHAAQTTAVVFPVPESVRVEPAAPAVEAAPVVVEEQPVQAANDEEAPPRSTKRPRAARKPCPVCFHPMRIAIELLMAQGTKSTVFQKTMGIDDYAARVHARDHLSAEMSAARKAHKAA